MPKIVFVGRMVWLVANTKTKREKNTKNLYRRLSIKKRQVKITTFQEKQKTFHFLYFCTYLGGTWNLTIMNIDKNSDGYKNYVESILLAILRLSLFDAKYINAITRQRTMSGFHKTAY